MEKTKTDIIYMEDVESIEEQNAINEAIDRAMTLDLIVSENVYNEEYGEEESERMKAAYDELVESGEIDPTDTNIKNRVERAYNELLERGEM